MEYPTGTCEECGELSLKNNGGIDMRGLCPKCREETCKTMCRNYPVGKHSNQCSFYKKAGD